MADFSNTANSEKPSQHRLMIWCVPRSGSTALLKCLSFLETPSTTGKSNNSDLDKININHASAEGKPRKGGWEAWFEPYNMFRYGSVASMKFYNQELPPDLAGNEDKYHRAIKAAQSMMSLVPRGSKKPDPYLVSPGGIKRSLETSECKMVVVKEIAAGIHGHFSYIPAGYRHMFLIRDPNLVFPSLRKLFLGFRRLDEEAMLQEDIQKIHPFYAARHWFGEIHDLWNYVKSTFDPNPLIIDTADLLVHPEACLKKICDVMGVAFRTGLLEWDASLSVVGKWKSGAAESLSADGLREALGMKRAFESSHFVPPSTQSPHLSELTPDCIRIAKECQGWYREMYEHRFVPKKD